MGRPLGACRRGLRSGGNTHPWSERTVRSVPGGWSSRHWWRRRRSEPAGSSDDRRRGRLRGSSSRTGWARPGSAICSEGIMRESDAGEVQRLYWRTDTPSIVIRQMFGIEARRPDAVARAAGPAKIELYCWECSQPSEAVVRSREERKHYLRERFPWPFYCPTCEKARADRMAAEEQQRQQRLHRLRTMPYGEYLLTREWKERRTTVVRRAGGRCMVCNRQRPLEVHHRTYERRGDEDWADLIALCDECHGRHHGAPR